MSKMMFDNFKENTKDFFLLPDDGSGAKRKPNLKNIYAVLIGGFVGWLIITVTFGTKLKALVKKVPVLNMVFPRAKATYSRAKASVARRRTTYRAKRTRK